MTDGKLLRGLFKPKSVAIVGASNDPQRVGGRPLRFLREAGFSGPIFPVNPTRSTVQGIPAFPSLAEVPEAPDVAIVAVPAKQTIEVIEAAAATEIPYAIVLSDGFAEAGDVRLQQRLLEAKGPHLRLLGPNCPGLVNFTDGIPLAMSSFLNQGIHGSGSLALISQSGGVATPLISRAQEREIGISFYVAPGNQADLTVEDFIEFAIADSSTRAIGCVIEGFTDPRRFQALAQEARCAGKPVVVLKLGRSPESAESAKSHTGSVVGSYEAYKALFESAGVVEAVDPDDIAELAVACSFRGQLRRPGGVGLLSFSGGGATLLADRAASHGLPVPPLSAGSIERLKDLLQGTHVRIANPIDLTGRVLHNPELFPRVLDIFLSDPNIGVLVVGAFLAAPDAADKMADALVERADTVGKPVLVVTPSGAINGDAYRRIQRAALPTFVQPDKAIMAAALLLGPPLQRDNADFVAVADAGSDLNDVHVMTESMAKAWLKTQGITVPHGYAAASEVEAREAGGLLVGPVVVKVSAPNLLHKSDAKLIRLNVEGPEAIAEVGRELLDSAYALGMNDAQLLVEEMITAEYEVFVGLRRDPDVGLLVAVGFGGVYSELLGGHAIALASTERECLADLIATSQVGRLLSGIRGHPEADVDALIELVQRATGAMCKEESMTTLEMNPVLVGAAGSGVAVAVDAVIAWGPNG